MQKHFSKKRGPRTPAQKAARRAALMQNVPGNSDVDEAMLDTATAMSMVRVAISLASNYHHPRSIAAVTESRTADAFIPGNGRWSTHPCYLTARTMNSLASTCTLMMKRPFQALAPTDGLQK